MMTDRIFNTPFQSKTLTGLRSFPKVARPTLG
jgi:hypothetical protein